MAKIGKRSAAAQKAFDGKANITVEEAVTLIKGLALPEAQMQELTRALKQKCGVGGALKTDHIEIQGDQRPAIKAELEKRGFTVKIAGG